MLGLFKRQVSAGWYVGAGIAFLLVGTPPAVVNTGFRVTLIVLGGICFLGAGYEWWHRGAAQDAGVDASSQVLPDVTLWSADFPGHVADIKVLARSLERYAFAHDVVITNRGATKVILTAALLIQWANRPLFCMAVPRESDLPEWNEVIAAFGFTAKRQLIFPLNLEGHTSVSGHIIFDLREVGHAVGGAINQFVGGLKDDSEQERNREYRLQFRDELTFDEQAVDVLCVYAPRLDGSGVSDVTDLAVAGHASTLNLWRG